MKKRALSLLAALCLLLTLVPAVQADVMYLSDGDVLDTRGDAASPIYGSQITFWDEEDNEFHAVEWDFWVPDGGWWGFQTSPARKDGDFMYLIRTSDGEWMDTEHRPDGSFYFQFPGGPEETYALTAELISGTQYTITATYYGDQRPRGLDMEWIFADLLADFDCTTDAPRGAYPGETVTFTVYGDPERIPNVIGLWVYPNEGEPYEEAIYGQDGVFSFVMPDGSVTFYPKDPDREYVDPNNIAPVSVRGWSLYPDGYAIVGPDGYFTYTDESENWNVALTGDGESGYTLTLRNAVIVEEDYYALELNHFDGTLVLEGENRVTGTIGGGYSPRSLTVRGSGTLLADNMYLDSLTMESGTLSLRDNLYCFDTLTVSGGRLAVDGYGFGAEGSFQMTGGEFIARAASQGLYAFQVLGGMDTVELGPNVEIKCPAGGQLFSGEYFSESIYEEDPDWNYRESGIRTMIFPAGETGMVSHIQTDVYEEYKSTDSYTVVDNAAKVVVLGEKGKAVPSWIGDVPGLAYTSTQPVDLDGRKISLPAYALKDENGNDTNYIKLRDLAALLNGSAAQFEVGWDGAVNITPHTPYTPVGGEGSVPFAGDRDFTAATAETRVGGAAAGLTAILLTDDEGGGYTYYKLRDLGQALGFNVGWSADKGIFLETDKPYDPAN